MKKSITLILAIILLTACGKIPVAITEETPEIKDVTIETITTPAEITETTIKPLEITACEPINTPPNSLTNEELRLWNSIAEKADKEIVFYDIDDYDNDGNLEMFAVIGEISDRIEVSIEEGFHGEMWFAGNKGATLVPWEWAGGNFDFLNVGTDKYIIMFLPSSNWYPCFVFGSRNGELYYAEEVSDYKYLPESSDLHISAMRLMFNDDEELIMTESAYDCTVPNTGGHSWKDYWFYYDENERKFKEYGGIEITLSQFMTFKNAREVINLIREEQVIYSIIYRGNGVINVNLRQKYSSESLIDYFEVSEIYYQNYITVRYKDKEIYQIVEQEGYSAGLGAYLPALIPEIAAYPDITGLFD